MLGRELTPWQTPFHSLSSLRRDMDELFARFFGEGEQSGSWMTPTMSTYAPQIQSWVHDHTLPIKADLPGIDPKDVEVTVEGNVLTLKGERKAEQEKKEDNYFHQEVRYGSFVRTLTIPEGIKAEEVQASYKNGVLELTIPLPAEMRPKRVQIALEGPANGQQQLSEAK
jgi:HSP20 family protein